MKKTVLFGAGSVASQVILYNRSLHIVAVVDNDKRKAGSLFHGIPIVAVESLLHIDFDEVMVTTGMIHDAKAQLIEQCEIAEDKIVLPNQHLTKSLEVLAFRDHQRVVTQLLTKLTSSKIADKLQIIVDLDTLKDLAQLGHIRPEVSLIHFSLPCSGLVQLRDYLNQELSLLSAADKYSGQLHPMKSLSDEIIAYIVEISFLGFENRPVNFIFRGYLDVNEYAIDLPGQAMFFSPLSLRSQTVLHRFGEITCRVPLHWEQYLTFIFDHWQERTANLRLHQYTHRGYGSMPAHVQHELQLKAPWIFAEREDISVVMVVYNNIDYLHDAIESVLLQLAPYRFVIHCVDDASSDGSSDLLREYQQKFSQSLILYISDTNQGTGKKSLFKHRPQVKGDFWIFLSGDDFWLTPFNLWFQTNYLLDSPMAAGCSCATIMRDEATDYETIIAPQAKRWNVFDLLLLRKKFRFYTHTSSILWRNIFYKERNFFLPPKYELPESHGDVMLAHFMLENGAEMHMLNRIMNFYRYSRRGVWSSKSKEEQTKINEKLHDSLYKMISMRTKFLCKLHQSSIIPNCIKRIVRGPING